MTSEQGSHLVEQVSAVAFAATLQSLTGAIEKAGMTVFARIDHAAGARAAGLSMPPATVPIYGSPKGGTPIMLSSPQAALDLPLRVLVREAENGQTLVSFHPVRAMLVETGVPEDLAARLEPAQQILLKAIA